jgi:hypothetical protein
LALPIGAMAIGLVFGTLAAPLMKDSVIDKWLYHTEGRFFRLG